MLIYALLFCAVYCLASAASYALEDLRERRWLSALREPEEITAPAVPAFTGLVERDGRKVSDLCSCARPLRRRGFPLSLRRAAPRRLMGAASA